VSWETPRALWLVREYWEDIFHFIFDISHLPFAAHLGFASKNENEKWKMENKMSWTEN
jgi:hypothetical protein